MKSKNSWFEKLCMLGEESEANCADNQRQSRSNAAKKSEKSQTENVRRKKNAKRRLTVNHDNAPYAEESYTQVPPIDDCVFDDTVYTPFSSGTKLQNGGGRNVGKSGGNARRGDAKEKSPLLRNTSAPQFGDAESEKGKSARKQPFSGNPSPRPPKYGKQNGSVSHPVLLYISLAVGFFLTVSVLLSFFMSRGQFDWTADTHPFRWIGYHTERFLFGVLGHGAYLLPVAMMYIPLDYFINRRGNRIPLQWILSGVMIALFSAAVHTCMRNAGLCAETWNFAELYKAGADKAAGGIVGGYLGGLSYLGLGTLGTVAVGVVGFLLSGIFLVGTTPAGVWRWMRVLHERRATRRVRRRDSRAEADRRKEEKMQVAAERKTVEGPLAGAEDNRKGKHTSRDEIAVMRETDAFNPAQSLLTNSLVRSKDKEPAKKQDSAFDIPADEPKPSDGAAVIKPFTPREVDEIFASLTDGNGIAQTTETVSEITRNTEPIYADDVRLSKEKPVSDGMRTNETKEKQDTVIGTPFGSDDSDAERMKKDITSYPNHARFAVEETQIAVVENRDGSKLQAEEAPNASDVVIPMEFDNEEPYTVEETTDDAEERETTFTKAEDYAGGFDYGAEGNEGEAAESADESTLVREAAVVNQNGVQIQVQTMTEEERKRGNQIVTDAQVRQEQEQKKKPYVYPTIDLLEPEKPRKETLEEKVQLKMRMLNNALSSFKVRIDNISYVYGPTVTRYEIRPAPGVRVRTITALADDIAMALSAPSIRIEAPIAGMNAVGIEIPNDERETVSLRSLIDSDEFRNRKSKLTSALGKDVAGNPIFFDIYKMPHLLIAGTTGSGKSVCINSIIMSLLYKSTPEEVKLIMIDPKTVEFSVYRDIPHLLAPIVCDSKRAAAALNLAVLEMEDRYNKIREVGVRDIGSYNAITANDRYEHPYMPHIVIIIDELADLMMTARDEVEKSIGRLSQKARAAGMHLIIGTQRPSVDVITGIIKANVPSRIAFTVVAQVDSRTILDVSGAEKLIGMGDMLYAPVGSPKPLRVQGSFVSDDDVQRVVDFIKRKNEPVQYNQDFINNLDREAEMIGTKRGGGERDSGEEEVSSDGLDTKFYEALRVAVENKRISTSLLQRTLSIGYGRAAKIIDEMEKRGFIGPAVGNRPRDILIDRDGYMEALAKRED